MVELDPLNIGAVNISRGGTGATTAAQARANLGLSKELFDTDYATLALADAAAVEAGKHLVLSGQWDAVPAAINAPVRCVFGARLNNATALEFKASFECGDFQVFYGSGLVSGLKRYRPEWFGADATGTSLSTTAFSRMAIADNTIIEFNGQYKISVADSHFLLSLTSKKHITIIGNNSTLFTEDFSSGTLAITGFTYSGGLATATTALPHGIATTLYIAIYDSPTEEFNGVYTVTATGPNTFTYSPVAGSNTPPAGLPGVYQVYNTARTFLLFDGCEDIKMSDFTIKGHSVPISVQNRLGYLGINVRNRSKDIDIKNVHFEGLSYGLATGFESYSINDGADCEGFDVDITAKNVGYPVATWGSGSKSRFVVNCETVHRGGYFTGLSDSDITVYTKDYDVVGGLLGTHLSSAGALVGCSNINMTVVDTGSTAPYSNSPLASHSLVFMGGYPGTGGYYNNITINMRYTAVSAEYKNTPFQLYPYSGTIHRGITLNGHIDRTAGTVTQSPIVIWSPNPSTVSGFSFGNMTVIEPAGNTLPVLTGTFVAAGADLGLVDNINMGNLRAYNSRVIPTLNVTGTPASYTRPTDSKYIFDTDYPTLAAADAAAVAAGKHLIVSTQWDTVPATLAAHIKCIYGAKINNSAAVTFTGSFKSGNFRVFYGAGVINFESGNTARPPELWGARGDGQDSSAALNTVAIQSAINSCQHIKIGTGVYKHHGITIGRTLKISGDSGYKSVLQNIHATSDNINITDAGPGYLVGILTLEDIGLAGSGTGAQINYNTMSQLYLSRVYITESGGYGIEIARSKHAILLFIDGCVIQKCVKSAIYGLASGVDRQINVVNITNTHIQGNYSHGVTIFGLGINIHNSIIEGNAGYGINLNSSEMVDASYSAVDISIKNNYLEHNALGALNVVTGTYPAGVSKLIVGMEVSSNYLYQGAAYSHQVVSFSQKGDGVTSPSLYNFAAVRNLKWFKNHVDAPNPAYTVLDFDNSLSAGSVITPIITSSTGVTPAGFLSWLSSTGFINLGYATLDIPSVTSLSGLLYARGADIAYTSVVSRRSDSITTTGTNKDVYFPLTVPAGSLIAGVSVPVYFSDISKSCDVTVSLLSGNSSAGSVFTTIASQTVTALTGSSTTDPIYISKNLIYGLASDSTSRRALISGEEWMLKISIKTNSASSDSSYNLGNPLLLTY